MKKYVREILDDPYVLLVSINDVPIGYMSRNGNSRGHSWAHVYPNPTDKYVRKFNSSQIRSINRIVAYTPGEYVSAFAIFYRYGQYPSDKPAGDRETACVVLDTPDGRPDIYLPRRKGYEWTYELVPVDSPEVNIDDSINKLTRNLPELEREHYY